MFLKTICYINIFVIWVGIEKKKKNTYFLKKENMKIG